MWTAHYETDIDALNRKAGRLEMCDIIRSSFRTRPRLGPHDRSLSLLKMRGA